MAESRRPKDYYHKLHHMGSGGAAIYVPAAWVKKMGLAPGTDHVRITDIKDGRLIISKPH